MKVLLHSDKQEQIAKSGVGRAIVHQQEALRLNGVEYTLDPKDTDYDIIHINTIFPESYLMGKKAKKMGKKVIFHAHSTEEDFRNSYLLTNQVAPLFKKWLCKLYSSADLIITPTPYSKRLLDNYGLGKPIIAISNGIDLDFYKQDTKKAENFRKKYGFSDTDKIIISVGLYIERKGILEFVELAKKMPEYQFIWFGYSNLNTVPSKIKEAVQTKLDNLHFPGYVSREDLRDAYRRGCAVDRAGFYGGDGAAGKRRGHARRGGCLVACGLGAAGSRYGGQGRGLLDGACRVACLSVRCRAGRAPEYFAGATCACRAKRGINIEIRYEIKGFDRGVRGSRYRGGG